MMDVINTIANFFHDGGFWMYPILLVGATGFAIGIERFIKLAIVEKANRKMWEQLHPVLYRGDFDKAREMTRNDKSSVPTFDDGSGTPGIGASQGRY